MRRAKPSAPFTLKHNVLDIHSARVPIRYHRKYQRTILVTALSSTEIVKEETCEGRSEPTDEAKEDGKWIREQKSEQER